MDAGCLATFLQTVYSTPSQPSYRKGICILAPWNDLNEYVKDIRFGDGLLRNSGGGRRNFSSSQNNFVMFELLRFGLSIPIHLNDGEGHIVKP